MDLSHLEIVNPWALALLTVLLPVVFWAAWWSFDPMRRRRKVLVLLARVLVVLGVAVGLASVRWWHSVGEEKLCVVAVLDVSRSLPANAVDAAIPQIADMFSKADRNHAVGLVVFAGRARAAIAPTPQPVDAAALRKAIDSVRAASTVGEASAIDPDATNVEAALDLAVGIFPPGYGRRIILFSDGNATDGDAAGKAYRCRNSGIDLSCVVLRHEGAFDLAVTSVALPSGIQPGVGFDVTVQVSARAAAPVALSLYRNGYLLEERALTLSPGPHKEVFRQRLDEPGLYLYRAKIACLQKQASLDNDTAFAFTRLRTVPKVLVLGETDLEARHLISAMREGGIISEFRTADGAPENLSDLLDFDAVILNNLRSSSLNSPQQCLLRDYVELFGGAMLAIGLDSVGGYAGTPIEDALPVICDLNRLQKISTSVVVVADTSRSLTLADQQERQAATRPANIVSRPDIIKSTAKQILAGLGERDYFGLIGFGSELYTPRWVVRPQKVYDPASIRRAIDEHLLTVPKFPDPQALADLVQRMAIPAAPLPPEELARAVEALADPNHLPHLAPIAVMPLFRNKLKATKEAIDPEQLCQAMERLMEPNAFLARSNASNSIARAVSELKQRQTARKSIVLLSDGYFDVGVRTQVAMENEVNPESRGQAQRPAAAKPKALADVEYDRLAGQLAADGITISTIALKHADANVELLENIARWGVGQSYRLDDVEAFAKQFRNQMEAAEKPRVMEYPFRARKDADSPLVRGVDVSVAPQLFGYVRTAAKLGATNILAVPPDYEPLLASWDFGAGRTAVFTSDAQERWASLWVKDWPQGFNRLWSGVVHSLCQRPVDRRILPQLSVKGQQVELGADFLDQANRFINGQTLTARFYYLGEEGYVFSRTAVDEVPMMQTAPGRYTCQYRAPRKGIYVARVAGSGPMDVTATGFVVSLLAEETALTADEAAMAQWASAGGGQVGGKPETWLSLGGKMRQTPSDISQWAMVLAALIFAVDVALRRWPAIAQLLARRTKTP